MQFVFVYQREPHAGQLAFADVQQPKDLGERVALARRTCTDMQLAPASVWIDGMDDQSRALFGDLPSPAIVIDPRGVVRAKLPWAEPDALAPLLTELQKDLREEMRAELAREPTPGTEGRRRGAELWTRLATPKTPPPTTTTTTAALPWIAATGMLPAGQPLPAGDEWLTLVAAATLVTTQPDDGRAAEWIATLVKSSQPPVRHWALQREIERLRRVTTTAANDRIPTLEERMAPVRLELQLAELRREYPWLATPR